jgi:hypothetical protein
MHARYWSLLIVCVGLSRLVLAQSGPAAVVVGVALPQDKQSAEMAEPLRQTLITQLKSQSIEAVPLTATSGSSVEAEAQAQHCSYILYTRLEQKSGTGGMFSKLSSALPLGALTGHAGGSPATTPVQEQGATPPAGAPQPGVKRGDTVTLDYRLVAVGAANPTKADTLTGKAAADGQDVVGPLVAQLSSAVGAATHGAAEQAPATAAATAAPSDAHAANEHSSLLGGLWGHKSAASSKPAAAAPTMDCAQLTSMPAGIFAMSPGQVMSVEDCQKMQSAQQAYKQAASDPAAARPGDDQMTCAQITAELKQQQYTTPDKSKVAAAQATAGQQQALVQREYANMVKQQAKDQAAVEAASAADTATELATGGLVRGRALQAVEKEQTAEHDANNQRVLKEAQPIEKQQVGQMAGFSSDFAQQLQSNPRLARLMQLADTKHCKGGG